MVTILKWQQQKKFERLVEVLVRLWIWQVIGVRPISWIHFCWLELQNVNDVGLRQQLVDPSSFDVDFINSWAMKYEEACQADNGMEVGYGSSAYHVSKVLLNAYARVLSLRVADRQEGSKIYVNNVHPGTMGTNMCHTWRSTVDNANFAQLKASGRFDSIASAAQGSDTPVWLALLPPGGPSGLFWFNRKEISFYS